MAEKGWRRSPDRASRRTEERATALTWHRGCEQENDCWPGCFEAALDAIVEGELGDDERVFASRSAYWKYTHLSGSPYAWAARLRALGRGVFGG